MRFVTRSANSTVVCEMAVRSRGRFLTGTREREGSLFGVRFAVFCPCFGWVKVGVIVEYGGVFEFETLAFGNDDFAGGSLIHGFASEGIRHEDSVVAVMPPAGAEVLW